MTADPTSHLSRRTLLRGVALGGALVMAPGWASAAGSPAPVTIPALREWRPATGGFTLGSPATIVIAPRAADDLSATASVFADDLESLLGVPVRVRVRGGEPRSGEIGLRLGADDPVIGDEGYRMVLGEAATITANAAAGAFYGTRSLLQLLAQGSPVPAGVALDWPRYAERGLLVDIGRKHFSLEWLEQRVRELAFLKLNFIQLHFTEDLGWRIESDKGIHSEQHLTKSEVSGLVELAARHHITVIGEVDMPGHMGAALEKYPRLQLRNAFGVPNENKLDYTLAEARVFARELVEEYLPLFPGRFWHMGADEFLSPLEYPLYPQLAEYGKAEYGGNAKDGVLGFMNQINELVRGHGKTMRAAGDGIGGGEAVTLSTDIQLDWWTDFSPLSDLANLPTPQDLIDAGHRINNSSWYPTYYSNLPTPLPPKPDLEGMYETWAVHRFRGPLYLNGEFGSPYHEVAANEQANRGSKLNVWNDDPDAETEQEIAAGIHPRLRVMAQQTWESPKPVATYAEFEKIIQRVGDPPARR